MARIPEEFPGVRIGNAPASGELLWDGDCPVCESLASHCHLPNRPCQPALGQLPAEVRATAPHQLLWIEPDGSVRGGSRACVRVLELQGHRRLAALLRSRFLRPWAWLGYRLFANVRFMFGVRRRSRRQPSARFPPGRAGN